MQLRTIALLLAALAGCGRFGFEGDDEGAPLDGDGDGVADERDNCPAIENADQDNEDGDPLGDACDPCPPYAGSAPSADQDLDGVGDLCDPAPNRAGDKLVVFAGFARMPPGIELFGSWTIANGRASVRSSLDELGGATWIVSGRSETVSTRATIDEMFGDLRARPVGVVHELDAPNGEGVMCVFGINPSNLEVYAIANNKNTAALALVPTSATVGSSSTFASRRVGTSYTCDVEHLDTPLVASAPLVSTPNRAGLVVRSASATFDWAMIVSSPE